MITRSEELVLLMVWKFEKEAYSVKIREQLMEITGKYWSFGAVYMPLDRLTKRGLLESFLADPTAKRGGRSKRMYKLTQTGLKALAEIKQIQKAAWGKASQERLRQAKMPCITANTAVKTAAILLMIEAALSSPSCSLNATKLTAGSEVVKSSWRRWRSSVSFPYQKGA